LPILTACENKPIIGPLAPSISSQIIVPSAERYSGEQTAAKAQPLENPYHSIEGRIRNPNGTWSDYAQLTDNDSDGLYDLTITSSPDYGAYQLQSRTTCGDRQTESNIVDVDYHMDEPQSDAALNAIITPLVKPGSTTDGDIIAAGFNQNLGMNGNIYNNDVVLTVYDAGSGLGRTYLLDIQGSESDSFNSQKKADADIVGDSYQNAGNFDSLSELENTVNNLQSQKWPVTY